MVSWRNQKWPHDDPTVPLRFDRWEFCVGILILVKPDVGVFFGVKILYKQLLTQLGEGCLRLERWRGKSSIRLIFLLGMLKYNIHSLRTNIAPVRRSSRQLVCQYRCLTCYFWDLGRYLLVYKGTRGTKTWDALSRNTFARFSKINPKKHRSNTDIFVKQNWP